MPLDYPPSFSHTDLQWPELALPGQVESKLTVTEYRSCILVLNATDYWFRFEWQHRGSPHVHVEPENIESVKDEIIQYANKVITTVNPAVGSRCTTSSHTTSHLQQGCSRSLSQLISRCSEAYCLRTRHALNHCNPRQSSSQPALLTARNDDMINSLYSYRHGVLMWTCTHWC